MLFMVIERFEGNNMLPVYERVEEMGRGLPDGLKYVNSWIEPNFARCFQVMECEDLTPFQQWVLHWLLTQTPLAASLSLLRTVRAVPGLASVPVAIVTGDYYLDDPQKHELQALGAELHYAPLWLEELVTLARGLIIPRD